MLSRELTKVMKKQKIKFYLSHEVKKVDRQKEKVIVNASDLKGNEIVFEGDTLGGKERASFIETKLKALKNDPRFTAHCGKP